MRTLLSDGDIDAYQIASAINSDEIDFGEGVVVQASGLEDAKRQLDERYAALKETLQADRIIVCLSDKKNFRKQILPSYKSNRKDKVRPPLLAEIRQYMQEKYEVFMRPGLEADDVMGILSTCGDNKILQGERIIVSIDKDMKTVPGLLYNPSKPDLGIVEITDIVADYGHMYQTLMGDSCDGYTGCPGCGAKGAFKVLDARKPDQSLWSVVVAKYMTKGLLEADALIQARVARILRASDYDFEKKEPILWEPKEAQVTA